MSVCHLGFTVLEFEISEDPSFYAKHSSGVTADLSCFFTHHLICLGEGQISEIPQTLVP